MTYVNQNKPKHMWDSVANGYNHGLAKTEKAMTRKQQITKSKKLGPDQLKVGEMYFTTNYGYVLHRTEQQANPDAPKPVDLGQMGQLVAMSTSWRTQESVGWKEPFLIVAITRLHKVQHAGLRKFLIKVIAGEKMGWFCANESRRTFKKLEPNALQEDNSTWKPRPYTGPLTWSLLPLKQSP